MTKASDYAAFKDLQELTAATDEELAAMIQRGCSTLPIANFEDSMLEALLRFLRTLTGVPWVRAFQEGARPSEGSTQAPDGQYGIVWLLGVDPYGAARVTLGDVLDPVSGLPRDDMCEMVAQPMRYTIQLDVYRDAGRGNRQQETPTVQQPAGSAIDVLIRAKLKMIHPRARAALREFCIQYRSDPITSIRNLPMELVKNTFETRATATLEVYATPVSTLRVPTFADQPFEFVCPDFPEPTPTPEC